jgi:hypothetical protein
MFEVSSTRLKRYEVSKIGRLPTLADPYGFQAIQHEKVNFNLEI